MDEKKLNWINHAGFVLKIKGLTIYLDPYAIGSVNYPADVVFVTHPHFDHLNQDALKQISNNDTKIVVPNSCRNEIKIGKAMGVDPNSSYNVNGITFRTIPSYNVVKERLKNHPKGNKWVGYIITTDEGTLYHPGDTDFIDEMKGLEVDTALLPMGGTYTMNLDEAIEAAQAIKAHTIIPMHYKALLGENGSKDAESKFSKTVKNSKILKEIIEAKYSFD